MKPFTYKLTGDTYWSVYFRDEFFMGMDKVAEHVIAELTRALNIAYNTGVGETARKYNLTK